MVGSCGLRTSFWQTAWGTLLAAFLLSAAFGPLSGCATAPERESQAASSQDVEDRWGIRVVGIRTAAADYMLDFRYVVLDPEKASSLINRANKPYLIEEATGARFFVPTPPKVGPLRQTSVRPAPNKTYFILFANPGKYVKAGNKVTVVIGELRVEKLMVQ